MSQLKALVVEDDHRIMPTIEDALFSMGHKWTHVTNQEDAQRYLDEDKFDYVLLDLHIPTRPRRGGATIDCGANLLRWIRKERQFEVPVIIMTGYSQECLSLAKELLDDGADDFIPKPFQDHGRTLASVVRQVLEQAPKRASPTNVDEAAAVDGEEWLTVTQAAKLLMDVVSGLDLSKARARVTTGADRGKFRDNGRKRQGRRIHRDSFNTWRFGEREKDLQKEDAG